MESVTAADMRARGDVVRKSRSRSSGSSSMETNPTTT